MVGEVELEQVEPLIEGLGETELPHQQMNGADASAGDGSDLGRGFILEVAGGEDRLERRGSDRTIEPSSDFPLASGVMAVWNGFHSTLFRCFGEMDATPQRQPYNSPKEDLSRSQPQQLGA
jgi:hypothetical protein